MPLLLLVHRSLGRHWSESMEELEVCVLDGAMQLLCAFWLLYPMPCAKQLGEFELAQLCRANPVCFLILRKNNGAKTIKSSKSVNSMVPLILQMPFGFCTRCPGSLNWKRSAWFSFVVSMHSPFSMCVPRKPWGKKLVQHGVAHGSRWLLAHIAACSCLKNAQAN